MKVPGGLTADVFQRGLDALLPAGPPQRRAVLAGPGRPAPDADVDILLVPVHPQTGQTWAPASPAASAYPVPLPLGVWLWLDSPQPYLPVPASGGIPRDVLRDDPLPPRPTYLFRADRERSSTPWSGCRPFAARGCARSLRTSRGTRPLASSSAIETETSRKVPSNSLSRNRRAGSHLPRASM
ncbi:hypothetical protein SAV31267_005920 [Streptomyces avermitilis]|uniref:Uncharacterized protein n=1 Tax=Streptomyces avermitilis TaxID=33903 RepID=A0A4D4MIL4_STRAX|nr:hypothetical protein SAV31267_005920 [Streptomyces avermitilis]